MARARTVSRASGGEATCAAADGTTVRSRLPRRSGRSGTWRRAAASASRGHASTDCSGTQSPGCDASPTQASRLPQHTQQHKRVTERGHASVRKTIDGTRSYSLPCATSDEDIAAGSGGRNWPRSRARLPALRTPRMSSAGVDICDRSCTGGRRALPRVSPHLTRWPKDGCEFIGESSDHFGQSCAVVPPQTKPSRL
jgi:hypothetical protein